MRAAMIASNTLLLAAFCTTLFCAGRGYGFGWPALAAVSLTIPSTAIFVKSHAPTVDLTKFSTYLAIPLLGLSTYLLATLDVYLIACAATPWIFVPLYLLDEAKLVLYPVASGIFLVQRMSFYATTRAYSVALARVLGLSALMPRFTMLALGMGETIFMAIGGLNGSRLWYDFPIKSMGFVTYSLVKSVWLLGLPLLEEVILEAMHS